MNPINYSALNSKAQGQYNFIKLSSVLADYGLTTTHKTTNKSADFALGFLDGHSKQTWQVQLKSRPTVNEKYRGNGLFIAFPLDSTQPTKQWVIVNHDEFEQQLLSRGMKLYTASRSQWSSAKVTADVANWLQAKSIIGVLSIQSLNR